MGYFAENFEYILEGFGFLSAKACFKGSDIKYLEYRKSGKEYTREEALEKACSDYVVKRNSGKTLKDSMDGARTCGFSFEIEHICKAASKQGNFNLNKAFGL